jgi:serine/threonine protein kinase
MVEPLGRYEIIEAIGEGGFAVVYRGRDTTLDRTVALKELRPLLLQDKSWVMRFQREARTIARLDHPHIVPIYDIYEADQRLFIVMRLVDSASLETRIAEQGPLPWDYVVQTFIPVAAGLNFAHSCGVLHRDLKPANILLDSERGPMLSDFGLAKMVGEHSMSMTESGSIVGTPHYIAPEIWEGKGTSNQSDIYALGCILYEMVTGEKIIKGDTPPAVMMAHFKPLTLPGIWPDGIPAGISPILTKALAQNPQDRYTSAAEMAAAVQELAPGVTAYPITGLMESVPRSAEHNIKSTSPGGTTPQLSAEPRKTAPQGEAEPTQVPNSEDSHPQPGGAPQTQTAPERRRRGGCVWRGVLVSLAIFLVVFLAVGSFCAAAGGSLGKTITNQAESITAFLGEMIDIGEVSTEQIFIPVPEGDQSPLRVEIEVASDQFRLTSMNTSDTLIEGTVSYNVAMLKPEIVSNGRNIRLGHVGSTSDLMVLLAYDFISSEIENAWDLKLADVPMALSLNTGTAEAFVELGDISLTDLTFNQGAATSLDLHFGTPNALEMNTLDFNSGPTRRVVMTGLANTRAQNVNVTASGGEYTLDFSGELMTDMSVTLQGDNGNFVIIVPENMRAEVVAKANDFMIDSAAPWEKGAPRTYILPGPGNTDSPVITFDIQVDSGDAKLRTQ